MTNDNLDAETLEQFYSEMVIALREDLLKSGGIVPRPHKQKNTVTDRAEQAAPRQIPHPQGRWVSSRPRSPEPLEQSHPEPYPSYAGFQLVDVVRLSNFALIGFSWHETGEQIYVYSVDLYPFATQNYGVHTSTVIIATNLLERLGGQWYLHRPLKTINGLSFMELANRDV